MPVSGVVIRCAVGNEQHVADRIKLIDGVEVHGVLPDGQVIAVVEADSVNAEVDLVSSLHDVEGVVSVGMAYHNFEDVA